MIRLIVILFLLSSYSKAEYSDAFARQLIYPLAIDAYHNKVGDCIKDTLGDNDFGGQFTVTCDEKNNTCSAFVVAHPGSKNIVISFRGSKDQSQIDEEVNEGLTKPMVSFAGGGKVSAYFNNGFNLLWNAGVKDTFLSFKNKYPDYNVIVTGHSLGAAEATICAGTISHLKYVDPSKIILITFGGPRVGDKDFADAIGKLVPDPYRVVHRNDIVPHMPTAGFLGYIHIASEIWYNNDMSCGQPYVTCNEEESTKCSNQATNLGYDDTTNTLVSETTL